MKRSKTKRYATHTGCTMYKYYFMETIESHIKFMRMQMLKRKSCGGPLVVHAGEIYTANVHAMFCEIKDKSEFYRAIEVEGGLEYNVEHYNMEKVQPGARGDIRLRCKNLMRSTSVNVACLSILACLVGTS
jgi:hypothetical protein